MSTLWGEGRDLTSLQMAVRAIVVFGVALALVRIAGMRSFGRKSSFDSVVVIMLGAVLSRPIYGATEFWPTVAGSSAIVVIHRVLAMATARWPRIELLLKGRSTTLAREGALNVAVMQRAGVSPADIRETLRHRAARDVITREDHVRLEASGEISVVQGGSTTLPAGAIKADQADAHAIRRSSRRP